MREDYKGMTVNERLYASGLLDKFDKAVSDKDIHSIKEFLRDVELSDENITAILDSLDLA